MHVQNYLTKLSEQNEVTLSPKTKEYLLSIDWLKNKALKSSKDQLLPDNLRETVLDITKQHLLQTHTSTSSTVTRSGSKITHTAMKKIIPKQRRFDTRFHHC